ncbi:MAG: siderophore-interacting protein [Streptosporangiales bacterium]|nr:siderophore-interacting protein [Streptosporangiales bacterium]
MPSPAQTAQRPRKLARPATTALLAEVRSAEQVTPNVRRITLGGPALADFARRGADQWFRLFLPRDDQAEPLLPSTVDWWPETLAMPDDVRPLVRNYTVRAARPELPEIDVDFVLHGDEGPASRWAGRAVAGDRVGILDQGVTFDPPATADWRLVIGDETALPAVAGILAESPADVRTLAFVELPTEADAQPLTVPANTQVTWLPRPHDTAPGALAVDAVRDQQLPSGAPYAWLAGESAMVRTLRRNLVREHGVHKSSITFTGYWRRGVSYYT